MRGGGREVEGGAGAGGQLRKLEFESCLGPTLGLPVCLDKEHPLGLLCYTMKSRFHPGLMTFSTGKI